MKTTRHFLFAIFAGSALAIAQTASLTADNPHLAQSGGTLALSASVSYDGEPGALGWEITLPADWSLVSVSGQDVPQIAPVEDATGVMEFAYTQVPVGRAAFTMVVRYPANAPTAEARPAVLVRSGGKLTTINPAPVVLHGVDRGGVGKSRN